MAMGGIAGINEGAIMESQSVGTISSTEVHWPTDRFSFERVSIGGLVGLNIENNWEFGEHSLGRIDQSKADVDICGSYLPVKTSLGSYKAEIDPLVGSYDALKGISMTGGKLYQKDLGRNDGLRVSIGSGQINPSCN